MRLLRQSGAGNRTKSRMHIVEPPQRCGAGSAELKASWLRKASRKISRLLTKIMWCESKRWVSSDCLWHVISLSARPPMSAPPDSFMPWFCVFGIRAMFAAFSIQWLGVAGTSFSGNQQQWRRFSSSRTIEPFRRR